jgi:hypothetical protein
MEFKNGTIHNSWQTAPRDKLIEALQFQGAVTKEFLRKTEELHTELLTWENRMNALVGEKTPDIAGNRIIRLQNSLRELIKAMRDIDDSPPEKHIDMIRKAERCLPNLP